MGQERFNHNPFVANILIFVPPVNTRNISKSGAYSDLNVNCALLISQPAITCSKLTIET